MDTCKFVSNIIQLQSIRFFKYNFFLSNRSAELYTSTTTTISPLEVKLVDIATASTLPSLCGRFQFQCQTSKECIAVRSFSSF